MKKLNLFHLGKKSVLTFAVLIVLLGICAPMSVKAEDEKILRVGYLDYKGFINEEVDGTYSGYGAEYLAEISKYTGCKYEYVYGEWSDLLIMLKKGEIDLLCTAQYTEERAKEYEYSVYPIGYTQGLLYTTQENETLYYEDFQSFNHMTIGMLRGNAMKKLFEKYAGEHDFTYYLQEYDTEKELLAALNNKEIDAMFSEHLANHTNLSLLANTGADAYYLISYKNNPYMEQINFALQEIKADVDFEANLYHKYYDDSTAETTVQFTTAEKEFIAESKPIRVGLQQKRAPFSTYDEKTGTFTGICVDILDEIAKQSGLTFEYIPQPVGATTVDLMATSDYDISCGIERDNFVTNETLVSTVAFLESAIVPVGDAGKNLDIKGELVAAVPGSFQALQKELVTNHPNLELNFYSSNRECLDAVVEGKADVFIQNTHILGLLLQEPRYEGLDILPVKVMTEHTAMVMYRQEDTRLLSIINKCIVNMDQATVSSSLIKHTFATPYQYTFADMLYKFKIQIIIITLLVFICFILLIRVVVVQHQNEAKLQSKNVLLAEALAQADRASTAKSQFLSRMSHEIRTPMNAIVGLTEIAKLYEKEPKKIDNYLGKIAASSKVLLNIINDVLDMSAIESNKLKIDNSEFDIKQVLSGISTIYYPQCESKDVKLEMATDVKNEILMGDALRLNQILFNLVSNAYKFTPTGGTISIFVKETTQKENTTFLQFMVSDTGCGMTEDMKSRLFKPFEQETAGTAQKYGGSGLGLSIAKNLVDMMHGAISVDSEKDKGTTFTVELPFEMVQKDTTISSDALKSIRVLVIDDNKAALEYTGIVLRRIGVGFDTVNYGAEAIRLIEEANQSAHPYDVCLIDWKMPDMDGMEITRRIRRNEKKRTLIIIVSAYDLNDVQDAAKEAGADHFVSKPLFQSTVFNVLMTLSNGEMHTSTEAVEKYDFTGHRVLLAEDQDLNAEIAMELLQQVNMKVDHAENGKRAFEMFRDAIPGTYDAILMDVQMPEMDGYETTGKIRQLNRPDAKTIPVFAMTANAFTEDISAALSVGMNGHIAKPIDIKILYDTLHAAINPT